MYHREDIFGKESIPESGFLWCLHCERCYVYGQFRQNGGLQMCPYPDCSGSTVCDGIKWDEIREFNPDYPVKPFHGVVYPLYGQVAKKRLA